MKKDYQFYIVTAVAAIAVIFLLSYANITGIPSVGQALKAATTTSGSLAIACSDSDNGADSTVVGRTKGLQKNPFIIKKDATLVSVVDYCYDESTLVEYTCENNYVATSKVDCTCEEGVCVKVAKSETKKTFPKITYVPKKTSATVKTTDCAESDNGLDYSTYGTITTTDYEEGTSQSWGDSCYSNEVTLAEWYCDENYEKQQEIYNCPNGCSDGACL
ncbi:hypothetical protein HZC31_01525 [Candidatus Woesearchaeota archaeon]|nr:hypothetical protein [Candidatus Woesearchaeota archaeon]